MQRISVYLYILALSLVHFSIAKINDQVYVSVRFSFFIILLGRE